MSNFFHISGESRFVVVLYDKKTGAVRHIHEEIFLPGTKALTKDQIQSAAISQVPAEESELAALHVSPSDLNPLRKYHVDLQTVSLVEIIEKDQRGQNRTPP